MNFGITINSININVNSKISILQACELINFDIPRFCYHERLSVAGNCRMCLVEIEKAPKLVASCAMPLVEGMRILTNSSAVKKAREGVLEFLLINHPLDCPICDQGGECDLQDQVMIYGSDRSRFREYKRAVEDKNCGPLIKMIMTRCIHCTRCIRFANEIAGVPSLGTSGRGQTIEVGTYIEKLFTSEFSGNVIDLCPVGALTSKPFMFSARPWELRSVQSIDTGDAIGSNIRIDLRGYEIGRVLPSLNEQINEEWISDKARFAFDGLKRQRLSVPLLKVHGHFNQISWLKAFEIIFSELKNSGSSIVGLLGSQCDFESAFLLKAVTAVFGKSKFSNSDLIKLDFSSFYTCNSKVIDFSKTDLCLLIGVNPRKEGAIVNLHLRKQYTTGKMSISIVGSPLELSFPTTQVGHNSYDFLRIVEGKHPFCERLRKAKTPIIIFGSCFYENIGELEGHQLLNIIAKNTNILKIDWLGLNFFSVQASEMGSYELSLPKIKNSLLFDTKLIYALGDAKLGKVPNSTFSIYQGHHGNIYAMNANLILPGCAFTEKTSTFINLEGKRQCTQMALVPPGESKEDTKVLEAVLSLVNYDARLSQKIGMLSMFCVEESKFFFYKKKTKNFRSYFYSAAYNINFLTKIKNYFLISGKIDNFYMADTISAASPTMVKCSKQLLDKKSFN
jgi:NADH-quinone oxidoreductase chain G